jgi:enterochelin esterase-like enzyme
MRLTFRIACIAVLLCTVPCWAQTDDSKPSITNVRGAQYPRVHSDGRVTFRVAAPTAQKVQIDAPPAANSPSGLGVGPFDMEKDKNGFWTVTIPPVVPGFHYYNILIDGVTATDPSTQTYFGYSKWTSGVDIPEPGVDFYYTRKVPHGQIRSTRYYSAITEDWRPVYVYTPPDYDKDSKKRYPVFYLRHGGGEDLHGWVEQGMMANIMDNLLAEGKIVPMLVVMENGYATRPGQSSPAPGGGQNPQTTLVDVTTKELMPFIEASFRTIPDREHRAMAGLSMGSGQSMQIVMTNQDKFAWVGAFSFPTQNFNATTAYNGAFKDVAGVNKKMHLVYISSGTAETRIYQGAKAAHDALDKARIKNVFIEFPKTAHEWQTWRKSLYDFAPRLFK